MPSRKYNPEKRTWRGKSHRKGGDPIVLLKDKGCPECGADVAPHEQHECTGGNDYIDETFIDPDIGDR